jgi:methylated-DNA-protein-cysteine methyltransferase-like protein
MSETTDAGEPRVCRPGFHGRVATAVRLVPPGRVTTYGDVAGVLGSPRVARQVGWALAALPAGTDVPWHRVVNARGQISHRGDLLRAEQQRRLLEAEGVAFDHGGRLDLKGHRWHWPELP